MKKYYNGKIKAIRSKGYNYNFSYDTGDLERWGMSEEDDPSFSPIGPEILDIEVSTICGGPTGNAPCKWCYKSNTRTGSNMSLDTFRTIHGKLPRTLTQIAFGIGDLKANPDLLGMFEYCHENPYNRVIPNVTINGFDLDDYSAERLVELCGAVSVSRYEPKDICYNAVKMLTDKGLRQCNIHMILAEETFEQCLEAIEDSHSDPRLKNLGCIVFLMLKPKGKRNTYNPLCKYEDYERLILKSLKDDFKVGTDSCMAPAFLKVAKKLDGELGDFKAISEMVEPCESTLFSLYINVDGFAFPCSFTEGQEDWKEGISVTGCNDFLKDVWYHSKIEAWRNRLLESSKGCECEVKDLCRSCPEFDITYCRGKQ